MGLFSSKKSKDEFLPIQAPPSYAPTPTFCSSKQHSSHTLHKPPPRQPSPPDWPSHMHYKCSRSKCNYPNPPPCAPGTYTCTSCRKGTYFVTPAMAESAVVLKQKVYKFEAENRRRMKMKEEESEKLREMRDLKRYEAEIERDQIWRDQECRREAETRLKEEKKSLIIRSQEQARKRREEEERRNTEREMHEFKMQFVVYEPSLASSIDHGGKRKGQLSLSDFPMPPQQPLHHQSHKSSSSSPAKPEMQRRRYNSGDRLRSTSSKTSFRKAPPRQAIPEVCQPYHDGFAHAF